MPRKLLQPEGHGHHAEAAGFALAHGLDGIARVRDRVKHNLFVRANLDVLKKLAKDASTDDWTYTAFGA